MDKYYKEIGQGYLLPICWVSTGHFVLEDEGLGTRNSLECSIMILILRKAGHLTAFISLCQWLWVKLKLKSRSIRQTNNPHPHHLHLCGFPLQLYSWNIWKLLKKRGLSFLLLFVSLWGEAHGPLLQYYLSSNICHWPLHKGEREPGGLQIGPTCNLRLKRSVAGSQKSSHVWDAN